MTRSQKQSNNDVKTLAEDVARLSQLLTRERENLSPAYLKDSGLRNAYVTYYMPPNSRKIHVPLRELSLHPDGLFLKEKLRILDIGSGPGTASLGVMEFFSHQNKAPQLAFTAVDQVAENLKEVERLFSVQRHETGLEASLRTIRSKIEGLGQYLTERFDLVVLSNVLNEVFAQEEDRINKRVAILNSILNRLLNDSGSCIIIEPALRETSREMLAVRDGILNHGLHVYSPCLFSGTCPGLTNPKDWCHEDIPWEAPELIKEIDKLTGLRKDSLKFSYLVLRNDARSFSDVCGRHAFRVVSEPLVSKGKIEFYICGAEGRRFITRLDKEKTSANQLFEELRRGTVVCFEHLIDEEKRYKVGKETIVSDAAANKGHS